MKRTEFIDVDPADVRAGDFADHRSRELDPRPVAYVDHEAGAIALTIGSHTSGLLPLENYTYSRRSNAATEATR